MEYSSFAQSVVSKPTAQQLDATIENLLLLTNQITKYHQVKKIVQSAKPDELNPFVVARLLDFGPAFITTAQAIILRDIVNNKFSEPHCAFHHVLASRVLDFWNLESYGGPASCYYSLNRPRPVSTSPRDILSTTWTVASSFHQENGLKPQTITEFLDLVQQQMEYHEIKQ